MTPSTNPNLYIIAGPNGAGKTTFATEYLPVYAKCKQFINADLIAKGLAPFAPQSAAIKAGRIVLEQLHALTASRQDFAVESTLSGRTYIPFLKKMKQEGYIIHMFFLWIPSVQLSLARIKERVEQGGHHIPSADVRRRFKKSLGNFWNDYSPLADYWQIFDNASPSPRLIAEGKNGIITIVDKELFVRIKA